MNRTEILEEAKSTVTKDRVSDYGTPEESFTKIAQLWSVYLGTMVTPVDAATMMILLKVARTMGGSDKIDNMVDIAGYAACAGELMGCVSKHTGVEKRNADGEKMGLPHTIIGTESPKVQYVNRVVQRED